jgi:CRP-like cAMP-binding protein
MYDNPFANLPPSACRTIEMQQGDVVFRQNQPTSGLYRVASGCVTLRRTTRDGDTLTLHRAVSGGYFAEASVFSDVYHCDAICTDDGHVIKIAKSNLIDMMQSDPAFTTSFTRLLAQQVQSYRAHIEVLAIRSAPERVLAAVRAGYLEGAVTEFASRINLSHEACYRALRTLCDDGRMVQAGRGRYRLRQCPRDLVP